MGANRNNYNNPLKGYPESRRFGICNKLVNDNDFEYLCLLAQYMVTRKHCQKGKVEHLAHLSSIKTLKDYLDLAQKDFKHS